MGAWGINFQNEAGGGGKRLVQGCSVDQSPTWQEYYFQAHPNQYKYRVQACPEGHAVLVWRQDKAAQGDFVRIEDCRFSNCGKQCVIHQYSSVDFYLANCTIDGGYFPVPPHKDAGLPDWWGTCVAVIGPTVDRWGNSPVIEIVKNDLIVRGADAWGAHLLGCGNGEVTLADNRIICASDSPLAYAGGVQLRPLAGVGCNRNLVSGNTIQGNGGWAVSVNTSDVRCEGNLFMDNDLSSFSAQEAGAIYFGPQANYNWFSGDPGAGVIDLGTGNQCSR